MAEPVASATDFPAAGGDLGRVIGFWGGTALIIGLTIGSGIFRKPPTIAALVPSPALILGLWTLFGIVSICGALTLAELSSMLPRTGGIYVYLRLAYGNPAAFVFGWLYTLITAPAATASLATVSVEFLLAALNIRPETLPPAFVPAVSIGIIVLVSGVNLMGTKAGTALGAVLTVVKVAALVAILVAAFGFAQGSWAHMKDNAGAVVNRAALARAVASVIWTYDGWIGVSMIAGEVVAPERLLTRIIVAGMLVIVVLYVGANIAYLYVVPVGAMALEKTGIAARVMREVVGPVGATIIGLCIVGSVLGSLTGNILAKPRATYAMARDGLIFSVLGHRHPTRSTPDVAICLQSAVAVVLVFVLRDFDKLTTYFVVVEWFALVFAVGAVFVLRRKMADTPRPFRVPLYPLVPLIFVIGTLGGVSAIVWGEFKDGNLSPIYGLLIAAAGFPVYSLYRRFRAPTV